MKPSIGLANLRQLACLGYDGKLVTPALIEALRSYVGFDVCSLVWVDEDCRATDSYVGVLRRPDLHALYLSRFFGQLESEAMPPSSAFLRSNATFDTAERYGRRYYHSTFFDAICRPVDLFHALRVAIRDGSRPVACLVLGRPPGSQGFSAKDGVRMQKALPFLVHALSSHGELRDDKCVASGECGIIILDTSGRIQHVSHAADRLLRIAASAMVSPAAQAGEYYAVVRDWLRPVVGRLQAMDRNDETEVPLLRIRNGWGEFALRAYRLTALAAGVPGLVGVIVSRHIPLPLKLLGLPGVQRLPNREKEVCLLLVRGFNSTAISRRLDLSHHTVITYIRALYRRFGVAGRSELVAQLMRESADMPAWPSDPRILH